MGNELSPEEVKEKKGLVASKMYTAMQDKKMLPDLGIDESLLKYSGLDSNTVLQQNYCKQLRERYSKPAENQAKKSNLADHLREVGPKLAAFTPFPFAAGLGALVISMVLDKVMNTPEEEPESPVHLLQRVFAEQKEKEVQDLMEEYLKRHQMHLFDPRKLEEELRHWERRLSAQLTRLKNSMLRDGHMSTNTLKIWANGAAFHTQMLIHLARLERNGGAPARSAITTYNKDLQALLAEYKKYKATIIKIDNSAFACNRYLKSNNPAHMIPAKGQYYIHITDSESGTESLASAPIPIPSGIKSSEVIEAFLDYTLSTDKRIKEMKKYFRVTEDNMSTLVAQCDAFEYGKAPKTEEPDAPVWKWNKGKQEDPFRHQGMPRMHKFSDPDEDLAEHFAKFKFGGIVGARSPGLGRIHHCGLQGMHGFLDLDEEIKKLKSGIEGMRSEDIAGTGGMRVQQRRLQNEQRVMNNFTYKFEYKTNRQNF